MKTKTKNRLLRLEDVLEMTGHSRSTIYREIKHGRFPSGVRIGPQSVAWPEAEIDAWIAARIAARDGERVAQ